MDKRAASLAAVSCAVAIVLAVRSSQKRKEAWPKIAAAVSAVVAGISAFLAFRKKSLSARALRDKKVQKEGVSDFVLTAHGEREWRKNESGYLEAFQPITGDPLSMTEAFGLAQLFGGLDTILMMGFMAKKGVPVTNMSAKDYEVDAGLDEWCEVAHEEPAEPLWPTVDPHHHIFVQKVEHGQPLIPPLVHSFSKRCTVQLAWPYEQLAKDMKGNKVVATVFIECGHNYSANVPAMLADPLASLPETKAIQEIANKSLCPMAIVSHIDLSAGRDSVEKAVKAHKEAGQNLVGVRHSLAWIKDAPICSRIFEQQPPKVSSSDKFREGMEVLAENNLSYDCWLFHTNIQELTELARACPNTRIICDHVGNPLGNPLAGFSREATIPEWRVSIKELAACENVVVKLSGLSMPNCGFGFEQRVAPPTSVEMAAAYEPYFEYVMNCFGPRRCFFASNFPVDKASGSFTTHWNAFKLLAKKLLPDDEAGQRALFYDNTVRTYRLDQEPFNLPSTSTQAEAMDKELPSY